MSAATGEPRPRRDKHEAARLGREVYRRVVLPRLTPVDDGKYVVLDIDSGEYEIDADKLTAALRLRARIPGAQGWLERVGHATPTRMLGSRRPK